MFYSYVCVLFVLTVNCVWH